MEYYAGHHWVASVLSQAGGQHGHSLAWGTTWCCGYSQQMPWGIRKSFQQCRNDSNIYLFQEFLFSNIKKSKHLNQIIFVRYEVLKAVILKSTWCCAVWQRFTDVSGSKSKRRSSHKVILWPLSWKQLCSSEMSDNFHDISSQKRVVSKIIFC